MESNNEAASNCSMGTVSSSIDITPISNQNTIDGQGSSRDVSQSRCVLPDSPLQLVVDINPDNFSTHQDSDTERSAKKPRLRSYQEHWEKQFPWLRYDSENNCMYCKYCCGFPALSDKMSSFCVGSTVFRLDSIRKHSVSRGHIRAAVTALGEYSASYPNIRHRLDEGTYTNMSKIINTAYFNFKMEMPFSAFPNLIKLLSRAGIEVAQNFMHEDVCRMFMHCINAIYEQDLRVLINSGEFFSILIDVNTATNCTLVYVRCLEQGKPVNKFLSIHPLPSDEMEDLSYFLDNTFQEKIGSGYRDWRSKLISFGINPSTSLFGKLEQFHKDVPYIVEFNSLIYNVEESALETAKDVPSFKLMMDIFLTIYRNYPENIYLNSELIEVIKTIEEIVKPLENKISNVQPSYQKAIKSIVHHFSDIINTKNTSKDLDILLYNLKSCEFLKFLHFVWDISKVLNKLSKKLLTRDITSTSTLNAITQALNHINEMKLTPAQHLNDFLQELDHKCFRGVELNSLKSYMHETDRDLVIDSVVQYISNIYQNKSLHQLILFTNIFDHQNWPDSYDELFKYGDYELSSLLKRFCEPLETIGCDTAEARCEWSSLKLDIHRHHRKRSFYDLWQLLLTDSASKWKNILQVIKMTLVFPISIPQATQGRLCINRIKSDWRRYLSLDIIEKLIRIEIDGPSFESFNPDRALQLWWDANGHQFGLSSSTI